jgi:hypothetical protein
MSSNLNQGTGPESQIIENSGAMDKHDSTQERHAMRKSGLCGGTMGGPGGLPRGSIAGFGIWRLNGVMMMGGMAGGADGGLVSFMEWTMCIGIPPVTEQAVSIDSMPGIARPDCGPVRLPFVVVRRTSAPGNCSLSHPDGGAAAIWIHWNHARSDIPLNNLESYETIMKKTAAVAILFLFALLLWNIDGDQIDGPLGALLAAVIMLMVGAILAVVFAGVGIMLIGGLGLGGLLLALAVSPLLLPLLLPLALIWYLAGRSRKHRMVREQAV